MNAGIPAERQIHAVRSDSNWRTKAPVYPDNPMKVDGVLRQFRSEMRELMWPGETIVASRAVTRRCTDDGVMNMVTAFDLNAGNADEAIRTEIEHFSGLGQPFEWKAFSFDLPADLVERLKSAGFRVGPLETVVIYDLAEGMAPFESVYPCEVRRIETVEQLADYRVVAETVFERPFSTNELAEAIRTGRRGHDAYVAYIDGAPVSAGRLYTMPRSAFAGLYGGGTIREFRGTGCYRAIVAARARDALAAGARYLQVDALPTSLPILKRLGFTPIAETWPCHWVVRAETDVAL